MSKPGADRRVPVLPNPEGLSCPRQRQRSACATDPWWAARLATRWR